MEPIELDILWNKEENMTLLELGIAVNTDDEDNMTYKPMTFYRIDAIFPETYFGKPHTVIVIGSDEWATSVEYSVLKNRLENRNNKNKLS